MSVSPLNGRAGKETAQRESPLPDEDFMGMCFYIEILIDFLNCPIQSFFGISRLHDALGCATVIRVPFARLLAKV